MDFPNAPVTLQVHRVEWESGQKLLTIYLTDEPTIVGQVPRGRTWMLYTSEMVTYFPQMIAINTVLQYILRSLTVNRRRPLTSIKVIGDKIPRVEMKISRRFPYERTPPPERLLALVNLVCRLAKRSDRQLTSASPEVEQLEVLRSVLSMWLGELHAVEINGGRTWEPDDIATEE